MAGALLALAIWVEIRGQWATGLRPGDSAYGAMVYLAAVLTGQAAIASIVMSLFAMARLICRLTDRQRRVVYDNTMLLTIYTCCQGLFGLLLIHGFPKVAG